MSDESPSLDKIERYLRDAETFKNYEKMKQQVKSTLDLCEKEKARTIHYDQIKKEKDELAAKDLDVNNRAIQYLNVVLEQQCKPPEKQSYPKEILESGLVSQVERVLELKSDVKMKIALDGALWNIYRTEAQNQVNYHVPIWPEPLGKKTRGAVRKFRQKVDENPFLVLKGIKKKYCDKCRDYHQIEIVTKEDVRELLIHKVVFPPPSPIIDLINPHTIPIYLRDIVKEYLLKK